MVPIESDIILWGAVFGLLLGIVWSLKYIVIIDRRLVKLDRKIEDMIFKLEARDELLLKRTAPKLIREIRPVPAKKKR